MPSRANTARLSATKSDVRQSLVAKDFLSVLDLREGELDAILDLAATFKRERAAGGDHDQVLRRQQIALIFEKPSLRTRTTFTIAVRELGGEVIEPLADATFGGREAIEDVARNLERWVSGVVVRTFSQAKLTRFAESGARLHVVNALTDEEHPCQALADMMTLREHLGQIEGRTLTYVGDGNNVATSLAQAAVLLGMHVRIAAPVGYALPAAVAEGIRAIARSGATLVETADPIAAVSGADAVYTDVWASMGEESEAKKRARVFAPFKVNEALMKSARPGALFMHCLPAHRGLEVTDAVIDAPTSVVFDQAENRLHAQKALLALLMRG